MNRTVAADFFQLLSLPGTLLFVVLQSNAAFTNSDTQRRKKSLQEMNAGNSAMFHLQPLTASTDRKGPLQHISSCVSLDLTVFALSSWVSCQPRGSGFDIKLIASVTQCVSYCECWHRRPASYYAAPVFFKLQEARRFQKSDFVQCVFWVPWR